MKMQSFHFDENYATRRRKHLSFPLLVTEVTPGLLAGAEPDAHQFNVTFCLKVIKWKKTQNDIVSTQKPDQACMKE
jgi:hypothetical protein